jgi:hypothetical protein
LKRSVPASFRCSKSIFMASAPWTIDRSVQIETGGRERHPLRSPLDAGHVVTLPRFASTACRAAGTLIVGVNTHALLSNGCHRSRRTRTRVTYIPGLKLKPRHMYLYVAARPDRQPDSTPRLPLVPIRTRSRRTHR